MDELCVCLTFDIIGVVTMGLEMNAQVPGQENEILLEIRNTLDLYTKPRSSWARVIPFMNRGVDKQKAYHSQQVDRMIKDIVCKEYARVTAGKMDNSRSVLALSLQGTDELTPDLLQTTSDNLRTFIFAGHDTTSIMLQWAFYELSKSPRQQAAICKELDDLLGTDTDPSVIRAKILAQPDLLSRMPYTAAVMKETLRLHPPAATARSEFLNTRSPPLDRLLVSWITDQKKNPVSPPGTGFHVTMPDKTQLNIDGFNIYVCQGPLHRDPNVYGPTAHDFLPERWLEDGASIPAGSWRPFERGPRGCIGIELANIEAKVVFACTVRRYEFIKLGLGELELDPGTGKPILDDKGYYYKTKSTLFNVSHYLKIPGKIEFAEAELNSRSTEHTGYG